MRRLGLLALVSLLVSCNSSDFEGFKRLEKSIHSKFITLGDDAIVMDQGGRISLTMNFYNQYDSLIAVKKFDKIELEQTKIPNFLLQVFKTLHPGDSLHFIGVAKDFRLNGFIGSINENELDTLQIYVGINEVIPSNELKTLRANERMKNDAEMLEQANLASLLDSLEIDRDLFVNGIYYKTITRGKGKRAQSGDHVRVNYTSLLVDGTVVDNTYDGQPLEYEIGRPDQVLEGFSVGIALMREGGESLMIIPSQLAYGEKGSSSGIVPPFSTIIYKVKLENVGI